MGEKTGIEWTDSTWNPMRARNIRASNKFTGKVGWHCEHVSDGCRNCYAESINRRRGTGLDFKPDHRSDVEIFLDEKMLFAPLRWKKPRRIFVNSMSDTFAEFVSFGMIMRIFDVMWRCPQHTFQVLTKRSSRMKKFMEMWGDLEGEDFDPKLARGPEATRKAHPSGRGKLFADMLEEMGDPPEGCAYPIFDWMNGMINWPDYPRNVWLGVSAERQQEADERIPLLLATPAAVRFVSLEPLLGPINLDSWPDRCWTRTTGHDGSATKPGLDWVICGGESGPHARPMHPQWARDIRDQCAAAGVPFFFKQWGEFSYQDVTGFPAIVPRRIGKRAAGRLLDGIEHNGIPT